MSMLEFHKGRLAMEIYIFNTRIPLYRDQDIKISPSVRFSFSDLTMKIRIKGRANPRDQCHKSLSDPSCHPGSHHGG